MRQHEWKKRQALAPQGPAPVFLQALSPGPARWLAGPGAWAAAVGALQALPQPLGLVGEAGLLKQFRKALAQAWLEAGLDLVLLPLPDEVECCEEQVQALAQLAQGRACQTLIGFGGGKALDLAKWAAQREGLKLVTVPTSAATCAAASSVVVVNDQAGCFDKVLDLPLPAELCIVDYDILAAAPSRLLAAGLADTLAKWLEWQAVEREPGGFGEGAGWALAERAALICEKLGAEAITQPGSVAWELCLEACLLWSAQASCLGSAPAAAAHSLANALTAQAAGRTLMHGEQVGLGLVWQEQLLAPSARSIWGDSRVLAALASWGLPQTLPVPLDLEALLAKALGPQETVHCMNLEISDASARSALQALIH